jgi:hypothetical protein
MVPLFEGTTPVSLTMAPTPARPSWQAKQRRERPDGTPVPSMFMVVVV